MTRLESDFLPDKKLTDGAEGLSNKNPDRVK